MNILRAYFAFGDRLLQSPKRFWGGLSQWFKKRQLKKLARQIEQSAQAQRLKQFFARQRALGNGYTLFCII